MQSMDKEGGEHKCLPWSPCSARYFGVVLTLSLCDPTKARGLALAMRLNRVGGTTILLFNIYIRFLGMELKKKKDSYIWLSFFFSMISSGWLEVSFSSSPGFFHLAGHILSCGCHVEQLGSAHEMYEKLETKMN